MTLREKYGEWGIILGATEGVGKTFAEKIASEGMNVVLVGRREEKLNELGASIKEKYGVDYKVIRADFADSNCTEKIFKETEGLDMGFMSYVACFHTFGKLQDTPWEKHEAMINVNVLTFLKCFYHYMGIFAKKDRGAVINVSSVGEEIGVIIFRRKNPCSGYTHLLSYLLSSCGRLPCCALQR